MENQIINALLATQKALLGCVTPELRAVVVDIDERKKIFHISFFYDGNVNEEIIELWNCASTEASCEIPMTYKTNEQYLQINFPEKIPFISGRYAYLRKE
jgi:hypothetical protein